MSVERLIDELRSGGRHDSRGEFTLDRDKAREKMRRYQLASPQAYVTELIQAAVLRGASRIEVAVDADDTVVRFDGPAFSAAELDELWSSVFTSGATRDVRALRQLAIGVNGALGRNPRWVTLTSAGDDFRAAAHMELRPGRKDRIEVRPAKRPGTRIHVKKRLSVGRISDFVDNLFGDHPEEQRIRKYCRYCETPVILEGERVSHGRSVDDLVAGVEIDQDGVAGVAGFEPSAARSEMRILSSGVLVAIETLDDDGPLPFVAVVQAAGLKKNIAQSSLVQDQAFTRLLWTVLAARERAVAELCRLFLRRQSAPELSRGRIHAALRHEAARITTLEAFTEGDPEAFPRILARVPRWWTASGSGTRLAVDDLLADLETSEKVHYARRTYDSLELSADLERVAYIPSAKAEAAFRTLFAGSVLNVTRRLNNEIQRGQNRKLWRLRAQEPKLSRGVYLARAAIAGRGIRGEIGIPGSRRATTVVRYVKEGHLLHRDEVELPLPGCEVVLEAPFQPTKNYDGVRRDATLARAVLAVVRILPALAEDLALELASPAVGLRGLLPFGGLGNRDPAGAVHFLGLFSDPDYPAACLRCFGFGAGSAERHVERAERERPFAAPDLGPASRSPLVAVPCFPAVGGLGTVALRDLYRQLAERGSIRYVPAEATVPPKRPGLVLRLDPRQKAILKTLLGEALEVLREAPRKQDRKGRRQQRPPQEGRRETREPRLEPRDREPEDAGRVEAAAEPVPASPPAPEKPPPVPEPKSVAAVDADDNVRPAKIAESPQVVRENHLLDALRVELEGTAKPEAKLLSRLNLERLHFIDEDDWAREAKDEDDWERVASYSSRGVGLHRSDRLVAAALERFESDPAIVTFLASAVYTVLNEALPEVTSDDERSFHLLLAERAARRLGGAA